VIVPAQAPDTTMFRGTFGYDLSYTIVPSGKRECHTTRAESFVILGTRPGAIEPKDSTSVFSKESCD
jgi:hypothetical protein